MENGPFEDVVPIKNGDIQYSIAMPVYQRVPFFTRLAFHWFDASSSSSSVICCRSNLVGELRPGWMPQMFHVACLTAFQAFQAALDT